jgi:hypothetical protein
MNAAEAEDEEEGPAAPQPPRLFGRTVSPFACGIGLAVLFALSAGPAVLLLTTPAEPWDGYRVPSRTGAPEVETEGLALVALGALIVGAAAAGIVRRRIEAAAAGRRCGRRSGRP